MNANEIIEAIKAEVQGIDAQWIKSAQEDCVEYVEEAHDLRAMETTITLRIPVELKEKLDRISGGKKAEWIRQKIESEVEE